MLQLQLLFNLIVPGGTIVLSSNYNQFQYKYTLYKVFMQILKTKKAVKIPLHQCEPPNSRTPNHTKQALKNGKPLLSKSEKKILSA